MTSVACLVDLFAVVVVFRVTPSLGGFGVREVLLMASLCQLGFQTADLAVGNIEEIGRYVRTGLLDTILIRPRTALGQLLVMDFAFRKVGRLVQGGVLYAAALVYARIDWTPARAVLALIAPIAAAVLYAAVFVAGATVAFWWIDSGEFANAFTYGGRQFGSYPASIYAPWLRRVFAYGLGLAFAAYQPALALLGRADPLGTPAWLAWCTPAVALAAWSGASLLWRSGIRHYRSTGS
jgi:ABC-2 type transport system permease protein